MIMLIVIAVMYFGLNLLIATFTAIDLYRELPRLQVGESWYFKDWFIFKSFISDLLFALPGVIVFVVRGKF